MTGYLNNKKILITGSAGFLGRHLVDNLLNKKGVPRAHLNIPGSKELDLRFWGNVQKAVVGNEIIIHLAATEGGIGLADKVPGQIFYNNAIMGLQLMEAARLAGVEKFVSIGSASQYPKDTSPPFREDSLYNSWPEKSQLSFGMAKNMLLIQGQAYYQEYGFNAIHLVMANLYGPGDNLNGSHLVPSLIRQIIKAKKNGQAYIEGWGTGKATRDFLYVEDAAEAILLAVEKYNKPDPVNIGSGREEPVAKVMSILTKLLGFNGSIKWDPTKPEGQLRRVLDVSRAGQELGFKATTSLEKGLAKTVSSYRDLFDQIG